MILNRAILKVGNSEYDILRFNYKFQRDADAKGRPYGNYYGGEISVQLESTDNIRLFQQMIHKDAPTVDGSIEVLSGNDGICVRRIDFKEAYIYSYGEHMQCASWLPMITTIAISPIRLDFNRMLRLDRKWPRAPYGWQKYEEEEVKIVQKPSGQKAKIIEAYWIDEKKRKHFDIFIDHPITLFVEFEDYEVNKIIHLKFENDDKTHFFEYSGEVGRNGIMEIDNFQLKQNKEL